MQSNLFIQPIDSVNPVLEIVEDDPPEPVGEAQMGMELDGNAGNLNEHLEDEDNAVIIAHPEAAPLSPMPFTDAQGSALDFSDEDLFYY